MNLNHVIVYGAVAGATYWVLQRFHMPVWYWFKTCPGCHYRFVSGVWPWRPCLQCKTIKASSKKAE